MKKCGKCKIEKPITEFCKDRHCADGLHCWCKDCKREHHREWCQKYKHDWNAYQKKYWSERKKNDPEAYEQHIKNKKERIKKYRSTPKGRASVMWSAMISRVKNKYKGIEVKMSRDEFVEWAVPEIEKFQKSHPNDTPSLDRINSNGHYEFKNIRIISLNRNIIRSSMLLKN